MAERIVKPILIYADETHHSSANTYQKVMEYFKLKLFLGMTVTLDKRDDGDSSKNVYELFHYQGCSRQWKRIYYIHFIILELVIFP